MSFFFKDIKLCSETILESVDIDKFGDTVIDSLIKKIDDRFEIKNPELNSVIQLFTELKKTDIEKLH